MWLQSLLVLAMAVLGLSAVTPTPACTAYSNPPASPGCTLSFTPYMPPQSGPTTTIYGGIMTQTIYAVQCGLCNVTNIDNNPEPVGPFTTKTTSSMLTVTRVQCIPEMSVTTRGVVGRQGISKRTRPQTDHHNFPRGLSKPQAFRRADVNTMLEEVAAFITDVAPNAQILSGPALDSMQEIISAMFALNVADSGMNVGLACQQVQTTQARMEMLDSGLKPDLIRNLLCWIADHGYDFNSNRQTVYATLQAALWGLGVASGYTTNRTEICGNLGVFNTIGDYLGIHVAQYQTIVCSNLAPAIESNSSSLNSTSTTPGASGNITTPTPLPTRSSNVTLWGSGSSWPAHNITTWGPPISVSFTGTLGTDWSGSGNPQTNNVTTTTASAAASGTVTGSPQTANVTVRTGTGTGLGTATELSQSYNSSLTTSGGVGSNTATDSPLINNVTQSSGTYGPSDATIESSYQSSIAPCMPFTPTAKLFFPAISTTNSHYLFKRY
ncbi:hypothetical protein ABEF95_013665 [Exophiala dermatitidis]